MSEASRENEPPAPPLPPKASSVDSRYARGDLRVEPETGASIHGSNTESEHAMLAYLRARIDQILWNSFSHSERDTLEEKGNE